MVQQLLTVLLANGHALLIGVPGLAKTLLINTLSNTLDLKFKPDTVHAGPDAFRHHGNGNP